MNKGSEEAELIEVRPEDKMHDRVKAKQEFQNYLWQKIYCDMCRLVILSPKVSE